jgi:lysophospholipase L1-like esterase
MNAATRTLRNLAAASLLSVALGGLAVVLSPAGAAAGEATHYYLSLGDSLAASAQPRGDLTHGYAEQLHTLLAASDPKLVLEKMGCGGESATSMLFGSQDPTAVLSCGSPRFYRNTYHTSGHTQIAQAVTFLRAHKGNVDLITIDIGANDLQHEDAAGNPVMCLFPPENCAAEAAAIRRNLPAILTELRAAAGPNVPIVGMTYYSVFSPLHDPVADARVDELNATIAGIYADFGVPVADVAGAFHNGQPDSADHICRWTWFCVDGINDVHPNTAGYGVIADAFLEVLP